MPDFDFDAFNHDNYEENGHSAAETVSMTAEILDGAEMTPQVMGTKLEEVVAEPETITATAAHSTEEVDKW
jgi:hypothetical protein